MQVPRRELHAWLRPRQRSVCEVHRGGLQRVRRVRVESAAGKIRLKWYKKVELARYTRPLAPSLIFIEEAALKHEFRSWSVAGVFRNVGYVDSNLVCDITRGRYYRSKPTGLCHPLFAFRPRGMSK